MFEWLTGLLQKTVEWQNWGWNTDTGGAVGAIFFAALQGIGFRKQWRKIWSEGAAPTVSLTLFMYSMCYFFSFLIYGAQKMSITMTLTGLLGFFHVPILAGVLEYETVKRHERPFLYLLPLMIPLMGYAPIGGFREELLTVYLFGILGFLMPQVYRAWKSPAPKDLDPSLMLSFLLGTVFWFAFAFAVRSIALKIFNPLAFVLWGTMLVLWWKKGRVKKERTDDSGDILMLIVYLLGGFIVFAVIGLAAGVAYLVGLI